MAFISFGDILMDKLLSYSSKMKDSSLKQNGALCLMGDNSNFYSGGNLLLNNLFGNAAIISDYEWHDSVKGTKYESLLVKNLKNNFLRQHTIYDFSPHLFKIVQDSIRFISGQSEMLLFSTPSNLSISSVLCDSLASNLEIKKNCSNLKLDCGKEVNIVPISNSKLDCNKKSDIVPISKPKITMSVAVKSTALEETSKMANNSCNKPKSMTLNVQLANRKTKQLQKRSKKRRRRQKRACQLDSKNVALDLDESDSCVVTSPVSSPVCHSNNKNIKESGVVMSVEHNFQMSPNFMSSFVISVGSVSDDDSDWDSCSEPGLLSETADFEFSSLLVTNLSTPKACLHPPHSSVIECKLTAYCDDSEEDDEIAKFYSALREVNKKWNESTKEIDAMPKSSSKVSFAPDDKLVKVLPVEMYERKGEWETFALERLRFKRRIDELEKVLSPCFTEEHRLKVYGKLFQPQL